MTNDTNSDEYLWFAMSSPFNKEFVAKKLLDSKGIENFIPMCYRVMKKRDGRKVRELVPAIHNLIFVHTTRDIIQETKKGISYLQYLTRRDGTQNIPITVPTEDMNQFMAVTRTCNEELLYLEPEEINLTKGTPVRILGGPFDGIEGIFVKVKGVRSKRVVVLLPGVTAVATAEIKPDLIEVIKPSEK